MLYHMLIDICVGSLPRNLSLQLPSAAAGGAGDAGFPSTVFRSVSNYSLGKPLYTSVGTDILMTATKIVNFYSYQSSTVKILWGGCSAARLVTPFGIQSSL